MIAAWVMLNDSSYKQVKAQSFPEAAAQLKEIYQEVGPKAVGWGRLTLHDQTIQDHGQLAYGDIDSICTSAYAAVSLTHQIGAMAEKIQELQDQRQRMIQARDEALECLGR